MLEGDIIFMDYRKGLKKALTSLEINACKNIGYFFI
jgi:hypothetical protein